MAAESEVHIVDQKGRVLYPRGIIRGKKQFIELKDRRGGKVPFDTLTNSRWTVKRGYVGRYTGRNTGGSEAGITGQIGGQTISGGGNTPSATQQTGNSGADSKLATVMTLKLSRETKAQLDARAQAMHVSAGSLVRNLVVAEMASGRSGIHGQSTKNIDCLYSSNDALIGEALALFKETASLVAGLRSEHPIGIMADVNDAFDSGINLLVELGKCDQSPRQGLELLRSLQYAVQPATRSLKKMGTAIAGCRPRIQEIGRRLYAVRARLLILHGVYRLETISAAS